MATVVNIGCQTRLALSIISAFAQDIKSQKDLPKWLVGDHLYGIHLEIGIELPCRQY